ncbi:MAG TPA: hypothetical protein VNQ33_03915 [Acidimicrobiales bacterium]|nr:hypothetical protein [Acidimicrobiales bacterium]
MRTTTARGARIGILVSAVALVATACQRTEVVLYDASKKPNLAFHHITRDGSDRYDLKVGTGALRVNAPRTNKGTPQGSTTRIAIWPPATKMTTDQQSCATWKDDQGAWAQEGLALRIRIDGSRFRAIVVAKNIVYGANWQLNVYTWDSGRTPYFTTHGAVSLRTPFASGDVPQPLPWKVCARAEGRIVTIKGWRLDESEPGWSNPQHTGTVTLPSEWVFAGKAGWYAGHIDPGGTIGMGGLRTSTWVVTDKGGSPGTKGAPTAPGA